MGSHFGPLTAAKIGGNIGGNLLAAQTEIAGVAPMPFKFMDTAIRTASLQAHGR